MAKVDVKCAFCKQTGPVRRHGYGIPTDARAHQYDGALYIHATGGYSEGRNEDIKF